MSAILGRGRPAVDMRSILQKLQIGDSGDTYRRVLAVVAHLGY